MKGCGHVENRKCRVSIDFNKLISYKTLKIWKDPKMEMNDRGFSVETVTCDRCGNEYECSYDDPHDDCQCCCQQEEQTIRLAEAEAILDC